MFDAGGFAVSYEIVEDADATPTHCFGRNGRHVNDFDFDERWGAPLVARIAPKSASPWVGMFAAGGLGVIRGLYASPSPHRCCVVNDGLAFLVDVNAPEQPAMVAADAVVQAVPAPSADVLLLASDTDLVAVGAAGVAWTAPRLVVDNLRVLRASSDAIVCSGDVGGRMATITLTPSTGTVWGSDYR
jgi:hypothetical protein